MVQGQRGPDGRAEPATSATCCAPGDAGADRAERPSRSSPVMLRTARLDLRPFTLDDVDAMHRIYSDPQVMRHVGDGPVTDVAQTAAMLRE